MAEPKVVSPEDYDALVAKIQKRRELRDRLHHRMKHATLAQKSEVIRQIADLSREIEES